MAQRIKQMKEKLRKQMDQLEDSNQLQSSSSFETKNSFAPKSTGQEDQNSSFRKAGKIVKQEVQIPGSVKESKLFQKFLSKQDETPKHNSQSSNKKVIDQNSEYEQFQKFAKSESEVRNAKTAL